MQNLSVVFTGKSELEIREEPVPEPGPEEVLVETTRSLISTGTECICYNHSFAPGTHWDEWLEYPFQPGYSSVGTVIEVGEDVEGLETGRRVAGRKPHSLYWTAGAADPDLVPVPEDIGDEEAAWFGLGLITQVGIRAAGHELGDDVVVIGCGLLGQLVIQYLRLTGARRVIAVDLAAGRLEAARRSGATHCVHTGADNARKAVEGLTGGRLADVVYDITGSAPVLAHAQSLVRDFGTLVVLGDTGRPSEQRLTSNLIRRGLRIVGAHDMHAPVRTGAGFGRRVGPDRGEVYSLFFTYLARGEMNVRDLISHRFAPTEAPRVYEELTHNRERYMGVIFNWDEEK